MPHQLAQVNIGRLQAPLRRLGPTAEAFTFRETCPAPDADTAEPADRR